MFPSLRQSLAWVRARWHADLEFQHSGQQRTLGERMDQLLGKLEAEAYRLDQCEDRLSGLKTLIGATSQNVAASLASISTAEPYTRTALVNLEQGLCELDARLGERIATLAAQFDSVGQSLAAQRQSVEHTLENLTALRQELQGEQQRRIEWESRWEQCQREDRAAAAAREQKRDEERHEFACREQAMREERQAIKRHNRLKPEDYAAIESQGVFIVGSARSGTTILSDCLNLSPDIYLLQEAFFFCNDLAGKFAGWDNYDFAATFNARHVGYGNPRDKGTYVPTAAALASTPHEFLNRFRDKYRYLGEKVAFGPQPHYMGDDWESDFIAYQARYFYHSQYFVTARAPHEALWSMHKLFPERPLAALFECWLRSLRTSLELYLAFPHTHMILLEWLDAMTIRRISDILQTDIPLPNGWVGREHQTSALEAEELVPVLQPYRDWCSECSEIYVKLRREFSRETLQFDSKWHPREFVKMMNQRIGALLDDVMRTAEPQAHAA